MVENHRYQSPREALVDGIGYFPPIQSEDSGVELLLRPHGIADYLGDLADRKQPNAALLPQNYHPKRRRLSLDDEA